jgi:hypothetical protein
VNRVSAVILMRLACLSRLRISAFQKIVVHVRFLLELRIRRPYLYVVPYMYEFAETGDRP